MTREVRPPTTLLIPCDRPNIGKIETNKDLARLTSELALSLDVCAARIDALRVFFEIDQATSEVP